MGTEVQEQMHAVVDRDPGEVGRRYQKELVCKLPLVRRPCKCRDKGACRRHESGLPDCDPRLAPTRLGRNSRLYLQAAIAMSDPTAGKHLDHLQVWKGSEDIQLGIFCQPADNLRLAEESEPASISIDRRQDRFIH